MGFQIHLFNIIASLLQTDIQQTLLDRGFAYSRKIYCGKLVTSSVYTTTYLFLSVPSTACFSLS